MDELELLKKDWQKDESSYPQLTYNELYKMILKKSSSIVKWIFIISILEFVFWIFISICFEIGFKIYRSTICKYRSHWLIIVIQLI